MSLLRTLTFALLLAVPVVPSSALTINTVYREAGQSLGSFGTAGAAPGNAVGGGSLELLFETAAAYWESVFADPFVLTLQYGWFPRDSLGTHRLVSEGGTPHRETAGTIAFDNDSTVWFLDPTPLDPSEFSLFTDYTLDFGGGTMNIGREFTGGTGAAARFDLLTTAIHEVGHALGLASANNAFVAETDGDLAVNIMGPLPFAGSAIPVLADEAHLNLAHALLRSSRPSGVRRYASEADILANAQISRFTQVNLNPAIPEPTTMTLLVVAVALAGRRRRRR